MSYSLLLTLPSPLPLAVFPFIPRVLLFPLFPALPPPRFSHPSDSLPPWRCSIEIQFPPTHPSHLPTYLRPHPSFTSSSFFFFSTSPITPLRSPYPSGDPQHSGKEATGCIPRDKLRGSIIHGNLQAPLFKRRPFNIA